MIKICPQCNIEFEGISKWGDEKKFCSRSCSNKSRVVSEETKLKISKSMNEWVAKNVDVIADKIRICECCGKEYSHKLSVKKYCSKECSDVGKSKNISLAVKGKTGGYRERSVRSKFGYYKGIYCASTYELAWVIYNLDHNIPFKRFEGYILYNENKKYYPDFICENGVIEIKGGGTPKDNPILLSKNTATVEAGYNIQVLFKEDLSKQFDWVKSNYSYKYMQELYDDYFPTYEKTCIRCNNIFKTDNKYKTCCSDKCSKLRPKTEEHRYKISETLKHKL